MSGDVDIILASENLVLIYALVTWAGFWNNSSSNIKMPQKKQNDSARQCRRGERLCTTRQFKQQKITHVLLQKANLRACLAHGNPLDEAEKCSSVPCVLFNATAQATQ